MLIDWSFLERKCTRKTKIGVFLAYGTEIENLGIGANAEFTISEKLSISPSIVYYLPKEEYGVKMNWLEVNANANYYFIKQANLDFYGFAGLSYNSIKVSYDQAWGINGSWSDGRVGLNLGSGIHFLNSKKITPFAELKYVIVDSGQLVLSGGLKFNL